MPVYDTRNRRDFRRMLCSLKHKLAIVDSLSSKCVLLLLLACGDVEVNPGPLPLPWNSHATGKSSSSSVIDLNSPNEKTAKPERLDSHYCVLELALYHLVCMVCQCIVKSYPF